MLKNRDKENEKTKKDSGSACQIRKRRKRKRNYIDSHVGANNICKEGEIFVQGNLNRCVVKLLIGTVQMQFLACRSSQYLLICCLNQGQKASRILINGQTPHQCLAEDTRPSWLHHSVDGSLHKNLLSRLPCVQGLLAMSSDCLRVILHFFPSYPLLAHQPLQTRNRNFSRSLLNGLLSLFYVDPMAHNICMSVLLHILSKRMRTFMIMYIRIKTQMHACSCFCIYEHVKISVCPMRQDLQCFRYICKGICQKYMAVLCNRICRTYNP